MNKKAWAANRKGFTIVELLIVIVVIAILAAITIVAFNGVQQRAQQSRLASEVSNAAKKLKLAQVESGGSFPASITDCPTPAAGNICLTPPSGETYQYQRQTTGGVGARTNIGEGYELTVLGGSRFLYTSTFERRSVNEFVQYMDMAPIINTYGLVKYTFNFDIKTDSASPTTVNMYAQNGSTTRYSIGSTAVPVTNQYVNKTYTITPTLNNAAEPAAWLAFYGVYGSGNIATIRNLTIQLGQ